MTKKKPGAVIGRPKGSGEGLEVQVFTRLHPQMAEQLEMAAKVRGLDRSTLIRDVLTRWLKRNTKATR